MTDPVFQDMLEKPPGEDPASAERLLGEIGLAATLTWEDVEFLTDHVSIPVVLKGVVHPEDARTALKYGVDGLIVSNHGGRQLDGELGALTALRNVASVVEDEVPLLLDGGVRRGSDAFKALALGADAVTLGRPYIYGLSIAGDEGVTEVLRNFLADFDTTLAVSGHASPTEIDADTVQRLE